MRKHNSQLVANWFFPMETRVAASEITIFHGKAHGRELVFPWKSGLLILQRSCMIIYGKTQFATGCELFFSNGNAVCCF